MLRKAAAIHVQGSLGTVSKPLGKHAVLQGNGLQAHLLRCPLCKPVPHQDRSLKDGERE